MEPRLSINIERECRVDIRLLWRTEAEQRGKGAGRWKRHKHRQQLSDRDVL